MKRKSLRSAAAVAIAVAVVAGTSAIDSTVSASPRQAPAASGGSSALDVTVGETVAVTTDQEGNTTPLNLYLVNGQVSGNGSGSVTIPTGTGAQNETQQVSSTSGQVDNFFKFGGAYNGDMPISVTTTVKVDGQPVAANQGFNLNGNVEITYSATNKTSRMQTITFTDIYGETKSKEVDIPVPFGDSLAVTFGDGWDIVDTGTAAKKTTGNGTTLTATMVLFPVLSGVIGGTTQSVTVKARAQNANLPSATHTVVPINLERYQSGSMLKLAPQAEQKILEPAAGLLGSTIEEVLLATHIISGYTSGFRKLDSDYIDPLVRDIEKLKVNPKVVNQGITALADGLADLGTVLEGDAEAKGEIADVILRIANYIGKDLTATIKWLGQVVLAVGPDAASASKGLANLNTILQDPKIAALEAGVPIIADMCKTVGAAAVPGISVGGTSTFYGYPKALLFARPTSPGYAALDAAIKKSSGANKTTLVALQTKLDAQSTASFNKTLWLVLDKLPAGPPPQTNPDLRFLALSAACGVSGPIMVPAVDGAAKIQKYLGPASIALADFAKFAGSPLAKELNNEILAAVEWFDKRLDNPCSNSQIINPIQAAIKKYGIENLNQKKVQVALIWAILQNCGAAQVMEFFGSVDLTLAGVSTKASKFLTGAEKDVPKVVAGVKKVQNLSGMAGRVLDAIPGIGDLVANKVDTAALGLGGKGKDALIQVSDLAAQLQASLIAMNARGLAGDGAPYGNSTLAAGTSGKIANYSTYQITTEEAVPYTRSWGTSIGLAVVFLLLALGLGTYLFRRRINP